MTCALFRDPESGLFDLLVEQIGIEPTASTLRTWRSTN